MEITSSGSLLVIKIAGVVHTYPKKRVTVKQKKGIEIAFMKEVYQITAYTQVTIPVSSSMDDLADKITALL